MEHELDAIRREGLSVSEIAQLSPLRLNMDDFQNVALPEVMQIGEEHISIARLTNTRPEDVKPALTLFQEACWWGDSAMVRAMLRVVQKAMREEGSRQPRHCERVCKLCEARPTVDKHGETTDPSDFFCHHFLQDSQRIAENGQQWWTNTRANMTTNLKIDWHVEARRADAEDLGLTPDGDDARQQEEERQRNEMLLRAKQKAKEKAEAAGQNWGEMALPPVDFQEHEQTLRLIEEAYHKQHLLIPVQRPKAKKQRVAM